MSSRSARHATSASFAAALGASRQLARRAGRVIAGGCSQDSQALEPFPVFFERAEGAWKWDADDRRLADFWMAQGALLCGHGFAPVRDAVSAQLRKGTHFGGPHAAEVAWAERVEALVPSAEQVRFTSSGTEASWLALRIARAFTGRTSVLRFDGHYHGWHDEALVHALPSATAGISEESGRRVQIADPLSFDECEQHIASRRLAAIILEPGGGGNGALAADFRWLSRLRDITRTTGTLLIFDEVVSGFRDHPGGVQAVCGVHPDLTVLGKILCGGLPGAAVAGRRDVMAVLGRGCRRGGRSVRVPHAGTFNANPLSAVAGIAMLDAVADGRAQEQARTNAAKLSAGIGELARRFGLPVRLVCLGSSVVHWLVGLNWDEPERAGDVYRLYTAKPQLYAVLRRALLEQGADFHPLRAWVATVHDDEVLAHTFAAAERAFERLARSREFAW